MPLFDVLAKNNNLKVVKVKTAKEASLPDYNYVTTLTNSTKANALKQAQTQLNSGLIKLGVKKESVVFEKKETENSLPNPENNEIKKAIYCDFNGVLDDRELEDTVPRNEDDCYRIPKIACPHKIFKLIKLAVETKSDIVMTSMWRLYGLDFYGIIFRCIDNCDIQEYKDYLELNEELVSELTMVAPTEDTGKRTDEVRKHIIENNYTHFVVFEDDHEIKNDLNPIMTQWGVGLLDEHVEKAYSILGVENENNV